MTPRVVVVGLGPAGPDLLTAATTAAIESISTRFLRTRQHAAASVAADSESFDDLADKSLAEDEVAAAIVERLVDVATATGEVLYAVPGSPRLAEPTVELLEADARVETRVIPALSFLDLAWDALGLDPIGSRVHVVGRRAFGDEVVRFPGPFVVAGCDTAAALADLKGSVKAPAGFRAVVLQRLGSEDESVETVDWIDLDIAVDPDDRTAVFVPEVETPVGSAFARLQELVLTLRSECPWDREQTHESLRQHLLEETYEVLEAIDGVTAAASSEAYAHLEEELGDLLYQVYFHAALAAEQGRFGVGDVATGIHDKLRRRHPHVFEDVRVGDADEVLTNWEAIKRAEKQRDSALDGIPAALPGLLLETKVQAKSGVVPPSDLVTAAREALAAKPDRAEAAIGELLQVAVAVSRDRGIDPELALHNAATALVHRYRGAEAAAAADGVDLGAAEPTVRARYL